MVRHHTAHCLEAALFAAVVIEQHGYPPLVISFESIDELDHVIFVYQCSFEIELMRRALGIGGAVARSGSARAETGLSDAAGAGPVATSIRKSI